MPWCCEDETSGSHTRFLLRLAAADGQVEYSSYFGPDQASVSSLLTLGPGRVAYLALVGAAPMDLSIYQGPVGLDPGPAAAAQPGTALVFLSSSAPARARLCAVNSANFRPDALAAGGLISLFGSDLGPADLAIAQPDADGLYPTTLAGTRVLVNGNPVPRVLRGAGPPPSRSGPTSPSTATA